MWITFHPAKASVVWWEGTITIVGWIFLSNRRQSYHRYTKSCFSRSSRQSWSFPLGVEKLMFLIRLVVQFGGYRHWKWFRPHIPVGKRSLWLTGCIRDFHDVSWMWGAVLRSRFFWAGFGILKSLQLRLSAKAAKASLGAVKVNKFGSSSAHTVWLWTALAGVRTKAAI